ncbi:MAG: MFS transporter, partial [Gammaproteobacteria bacterium]|nr:MFS transporter [Gammaproteobacteria bacterium]
MTSRSIQIALASVAALMIATGGHYLAVVGMVPIAESTGWPRAVPSTAYSLAILGMGVGGIWMGRWSDRVGVGWPIACGACSIALGGLWAGHAQSSWELLVANGLLIGLLG